MKNLIFLPVMLFCTACGSWPQFFQAAETIATDTAIKVEISKETIQTETDLELCINVTNKEDKVSRPVRKDK